MSAPLEHLDDAVTTELPWQVAKTLSNIPFRQALYRIRFAELGLLREWIKPTDRVLEVGGSTGFQAYFIKRWCREVVAIDIASREKNEHFAEVLEYDGTHIPFPDGHFDVVCSSLTLLMLEDAIALPNLIREMGRVLREDGHTIHLLPNPTWSLWSSLFHPIFMLERAFWRIMSKARHVPDADTIRNGGPNLRSPAQCLQLFFRSPIGVRRSILHEGLSYRQRAWVSAFEKSGFKVLAYEAGGMFYTGQLRLGGLPLKVRRVLSYLLGSSISVLVACKDSAEPRHNLRN